MFDTFTAIGLLIVFLIPATSGARSKGSLSISITVYRGKNSPSACWRAARLPTCPSPPGLYRGWTRQWYDRYPLYVTFAAIFFIGVYPTVLGLLLGIARQKDWLGQVASWPWIHWLLIKTHLHTFSAHRIPTAWEAVFSAKLDACWVVVTRKNGEQVRGLLGPDSHISIDPEVRDLFISHTLYFNPDTQNYEFVPGTKGIYLKADEISTIELIRYDPPEGSQP